MANEDIKQRDVYQIIDGKQTDLKLHDGVLDDGDREFTKKINEIYRTVDPEKQ